jgi:hypothetical protein
MARLFEALTLKLNEPLEIRCDNRQTIRLLTEESAKLKTKLRHVDVHNHWLRQEITEQNINLLWESLLSDKSSHLRCWRLRSADQLPTGLVLLGAPGPHLQVQAASRLKLKKGTHNNRGINNFKTNNTSNTLIVPSKIVIILFRIL